VRKGEERTCKEAKVKEGKFVDGTTNEDVKGAVIVEE